MPGEMSPPTSADFAQHDATEALKLNASLRERVTVLERQVAQMMVEMHELRARIAPEDGLRIELQGGP